METPGPTPSSLNEAQLAVIESYSICEVCEHFVTKTFKCQFDPATLDREFSQWSAHMKSQKCLKFGKSRSHKGNGVPQGAFAFTLTKAPTDPLSVGDMVIAVRKVMSQKSCPVKRFAWYYEDKGVDANGNAVHPHIHGMYETESSGRIEAKHFKRAWPIWDEKMPVGKGFRGGYHRPVRSEEGYSEYIKKDGRMSDSKDAED